VDLDFREPIMLPEVEKDTKTVFSSLARLSSSLLLGLALLAGSPVSAEPRSLPIVSIADEAPSISGELSFESEALSSSELTVRLGGLEPKTTYVLCLNPGEAGSPTSDRLGKLQIHGWPLGSVWENPSGIQEGHWNFVRIQTDAAGAFEQQFELPLPAADYRVRLLVKTSPENGSQCIAQSDAFLMVVSGPPFTRWLAGTFVALAFVPLIFMVRGRAKSDRHKAERAHNPEEAEPSPRAPLAGAGEVHHRPTLAPAVPGPPEIPSPPEGLECGRNPVRPVAATPTPLHSGESPLSPADAAAQAWRFQPDSTNGQTLVDQARSEGVLRHGKHFSWIEINNRRKQFRARQALVFQILCDQDPNCDGLPQEHIVREWEAVYEAKRANPVRVRDIFRAYPDEPGDFIVRVPGPASVYRLGIPVPGSPETQRCDQEESDNEENIELTTEIASKCAHSVNGASTAAVGEPERS